MSKLMNILNNVNSTKRTDPHEKKITILQIGCGYWGPNLIRACLKVSDIQLVGVVELSKDRMAFLNREFPYLACFDDLEPLLRDSSIDAVIIATPADTHFSIAKECLNYGKHVFIEKPFARTVEEAHLLANAAEQAQKIVMSGHTFLYNNAFRIAKTNYLKDIGNVLYISLRRLNLGRIRSDVNAWWNFAPHDISILLYFLEELPQSISVHGSCYLQENVEDLVFATLKWTNGVIAHIHVSWLDPHKTRECTLVGSKKMLVIDDIKEYKLAIYNRGIDQVFENNLTNDYDLDRPTFFHRKGDVVFPAIIYKEPLVQELEEFIQAIRTGKEPLSGKEHSIDVVHILEAGQRSLEQNGKIIELEKEVYV